MKTTDKRHGMRKNVDLISTAHGLFPAGLGKAKKQGSVSSVETKGSSARPSAPSDSSSASPPGKQAPR